jgi:hypothetical protein
MLTKADEDGRWSPVIRSERLSFIQKTRASSPQTRRLYPPQLILERDHSATSSAHRPRLFQCRVKSKQLLRGGTHLKHDHKTPRLGLAYWKPTRSSPLKPVRPARVIRAAGRKRLGTRHTRRRTRPRGSPFQE